MEEQKRKEKMDHIIQGFKLGYPLTSEQIDFIAKYGTEEEREEIDKLQKIQAELLGKNLKSIYMEDKTK